MRVEREILLVGGAGAEGVALRVAELMSGTVAVLDLRLPFGVAVGLVQARRLSTVGGFSRVEGTDAERLAAALGRLPEGVARAVVQADALCVGTVAVVARVKDVRGAEEAIERLGRAAALGNRSEKEAMERLRLAGGNRRKKESEIQ